MPITVLAAAATGTHPAILAGLMGLAGLTRKPLALALFLAALKLPPSGEGWRHHRIQLPPPLQFLSDYLRLLTKLRHPPLTFGQLNVTTTKVRVFDEPIQLYISYVTCITYISH
jgi:hypothetical protein